MTYTTYDPASGEIYATTFGDAADVMLIIGNQAYIEGAYNSQEYYVDVDTQQPIAKGPRNNISDVWDTATKSWVPNTDQQIADAKSQRNMLLISVDRVNPVWYSSLTAEQQSQLSTYRQALLDVPQQSAFPTVIEWPARPVWL